MQSRCCKSARRPTILEYRRHSIKSYTFYLCYCCDSCAHLTKKKMLLTHRIQCFLKTIAAMLAISCLILPIVICGVISGSGNSSSSNRRERGGSDNISNSKIASAVAGQRSRTADDGRMAPTSIMSFLFHRHGVRTPFVYFEGIGPRVESADLGKLIDDGRKQIHALGAYLAVKHGAPSKNNTTSSIDPARAAFLSAQLIVPKVLSSSTPRCMESARILFKAFLNQDVEIEAYKTDYHAFYHTMIGRNIDRMMAAPFETPYGSTMGDYVNYLNDQSNSKYTDMKFRYQIVEAFILAHETGAENPSYAKIDTLRFCLNHMYRVFLEGFKMDLARETLQDLQKRLKTLSTTDGNFMSYSMSDIHIVPTLEFLGIPISHWPDFASAFELRILSDGSAILDQIDTTVQAEVTEKAAIHRTTLEQLKANVDNALLGH